MTWRRALAGLLLVVLAVALAAAAFLWRQTQAGGDPDFFEREIAAFEAADAEAPPAPGGIVFTGSSSIRLWTTLAEDMAPLPVVRRGFGGAHMEHVLHNAPRIVAPYAPRAVVVFVGTNDLASGKPVQRVVADFRAFVDWLHGALPESDLWILSMKPSKTRWRFWPMMQEVDGALRQLAAGDPRVRFVETGRTLLGPDGQPDDVYVLDGLHLNAEGYRRWTGVLKPLLLEAYSEG